jgi:RNA polymerase sigma factor (TIGR02999 family)
MTVDDPLRTTTRALLHSVEAGDPAAFDALVPLLYDELRRMARRQLARERDHATLHTTELVHEAWIRLADSDGLGSRGRAYFFGAAAQAMRRVLIESARRRTARKRGGGEVAVTLREDHSTVDSYAAELLDLDRALTALEAESPRVARVVECRYFGGMSVEETALVLDCSPRTVKSDWALARAWLHGALRGGVEGESG